MNDTNVAVTELLDQISGLDLEMEPQDPSALLTESKRNVRIHVDTPFKCTDLGNAERLVAQHGKDLRFCAGIEWLAWDGARWVRDDTGEVYRRAKQTVRAIYIEAEQTIDEHARKTLASHAAKSESVQKIKAMVALAESEPKLSVRAEQLDTDPLLLNVLNGTVDLRTGALKPHGRGDLITKLAPVAYDEGAIAPAWAEFLGMVQPDEEVRAYLQRISGYALTGIIRDHVLPIHYGGGRNGKGTFFKARQYVMGDYAKQIPTEVLMAKKFEQHPTELATLFGCRFAAASESKEGRPFDVAIVKQMTGGDRMTARFMRKDFFEWEPTYKIELITNHKPVIRETKDAIWERVQLIPWAVKVAEAKQDKALGEKLQKEGPGILNWMIAGCLDWQKQGLRPPESIQAATSAYRAEEDLLTPFLEECCTMNENLKTFATPLYEAYKRWCRRLGHDEPSQRSFGERLGAAGFVNKKSGGKSLWKGVGLRAESEEDGSWPFDKKGGREEQDPILCLTYKE